MSAICNESQSFKKEKASWSFPNLSFVSYNYSKSIYFHYLVIAAWDASLIPAFSDDSLIHLTILANNKGLKLSCNKKTQINLM